MTVNEKIKAWYELTKDIKTIVREKHKGQLEEIAEQVKKDFLEVTDNEIE